MSLLQAVVYGIVQGITEFLPISSTAHLRIVPALLRWDDPGAAYSAIIQLGTTAAVLGYFARDIVRIVKGWTRGLVERKPFGSLDARMGWCVIIGTIPVVVLGLTLKKHIENEFRSLYVIAFAAIVMAIVLAVTELVAKHKRDLESIGLVDGIVVGFAQSVALIPGSSRSGCTLTGGLLMGLKRDAAARFSFLLSIPATVGAGLFELRHAFKHEAPANLAVAPLVVGTLVSFVFGWLAIAWLLRFLRTRSTLVFIVYRLALGAGLLVLLAVGYLKP